MSRGRMSGTVSWSIARHTDGEVGWVVSEQLPFPTTIARGTAKSVAAAQRDVVTAIVEYVTSTPRKGA
jgi:hypothetical protein